MVDASSYLDFLVSHTHFSVGGITVTRTVEAFDITKMFHITDFDSKNLYSYREIIVSFFTFCGR